MKRVKKKFLQVCKQEETAKKNKTRVVIIISTHKYPFFAAHACASLGFTSRFLESDWVNISHQNELLGNVENLLQDIHGREVGSAPCWHKPPHRGHEPQTWLIPVPTCQVPRIAPSNRHRMSGLPAKKRSTVSFGAGHVS